MSSENATFTIQTCFYLVVAAICIMNPYPLFDNRRFFWNYDPMEPILQGIGDECDEESDLWVTPITSGFVQVSKL